MSLTTRIAIRHLRSRYSLGFISFSTIFSIMGLTLGIASLIIISCISRGFSNVVNDKLAGIDGHLRINNYATDRISIQEINDINSSIHQISQDIISSSPYIEKHAIVRHRSSAEGIIVYGVEESSLKNIFNLHQFTSEKTNFINDRSIIIGKKLAHSLNVEVGDDIIIIDIEKMETEHLLKAKKLTITNIFQTDFPEYDRLLSFIPLKTADIFFEMKNKVTGLVLNTNHPENINELELLLTQNIDLFPYRITTWKDRHSGLLEWLTLYDIPIKLVMIFIVAIGIFNIAASLWMIVIEKTKDFGIMKVMGLTGGKIKIIIVKEGLYIGFTGACGGIALSLIILYLQKTYHLIPLSNDIYFMNFLPVYLDPIYFLTYPFCAFLIAIIFSYYPAQLAAKISPSDALHYE